MRSSEGEMVLLRFSGLNVVEGDALRYLSKKLSGFLLNGVSNFGR